MAFLKRAFQSWWVRLAAILLLGFPILAIFLSRAAEKYLASERQIGGLHIHFHGAKVSPALGFHADSLEIRFSQGRSFATHLKLSFFDWDHPFSSRPIVRLMADSLDLALTGPKKASKTGPVKFPSIKFYLPVGIDWRILTLKPGLVPVIRVEQAMWRSHGFWGVRGLFHGDWVKDSVNLSADFDVTARWRGGNLRYRMMVRENQDSLFVTGNRDRADLSLGEDSLAAFISNPVEKLHTTKPLPGLRMLKVSGKVDWRERKSLLSGNVHSEEFGMLSPTKWEFSMRYGATGGAWKISGSGSQRQSLDVEGKWRMPEAWLKKPDLDRMTGRASGQIRGLNWPVGKWKLPIDFSVNSIRLEAGRKAHAELTSRDSSRVEADWNGARPGRVEFSGHVSPRETWATVWTDTNVSFRDAFVQGAWENKRLQATSKIHGIRAYKFQADSLEAKQEVNSTGFYLRSARIFHQSEIFRGSGHVEWKTPQGLHRVSLNFQAEHPDFGKIRVAMPSTEQLECWADGVHVYKFPYLPLLPFARYRPFADGRFAWNLVTGKGESDVRASFAFREKGLRLHANAAWDRDTLHLDSVNLATGSAKFFGAASVGLQGKSLVGLAKFRLTSMGPGRMQIENLRIEDVLALAGSTGRTVDGTVNGNLSYDPSGGWDGEIQTGVVRSGLFPAGLEISRTTLRGLGDSVHFSAVTASKRHNQFNDTLEAGLSGFRNEQANYSATVRSGDFVADFSGTIQGWKDLRGLVNARGRLPLSVKAGTLEDIYLDGDFSFPLRAAALQEARFHSRPFRARYSAAVDTQWMSGSLVLEHGVLNSTDLILRHSQGGEARGTCEFRLSPPALRADFAGPEFRLVLPLGRRVTAQGLAGSLQWELGKPFRLVAESRSGTFSWPKDPAKIQGGFERVSVNLIMPPDKSGELSKVEIKGRLKDFLFQRKIGFKASSLTDIPAFFRRFKKDRSVAKRSRSWDLSMDFEAIGTQNRIDTDILRLNFVGDIDVRGVNPYLLLRGKVSGLNGEIGQSRQAFSLRDLEVKWEDGTVEEGTIILEGGKKIQADCGKPESKRTCEISINIDGRLDEMGFTYDTDCGESEGEPVAPSTLINAMVKGCYYSDPNRAEGINSETIITMLEPKINEQLSRVGSKFTQGLIKSTQVSGLGSLVGGDTTGYEPVAIEVESKEKYRMSLKGKAGYYPEQKLANPWEYRLAAEYRPPFERWVSDSGWKSKVKNRFTVETSVETRPPEARDIEGQRQVSKQVGLRYRYRFWDWW